jgi:hypothetical protein
MFGVVDIFGLRKQERPRLEDEAAPIGELCAAESLEDIGMAERWVEAG